MFFRQFDDIVVYSTINIPSCDNDMFCTLVLKILKNKILKFNVNISTKYFIAFCECAGLVINDYYALVISDKYEIFLLESEMYSK